jgi:hypothetical protein
MFKIKKMRGFLGIMSLVVFGLFFYYSDEIYFWMYDTDTLAFFQLVSFFAGMFFMWIESRDRDGTFIIPMVAFLYMSPLGSVMIGVYVLFLFIKLITYEIFGTGEHKEDKI